MKLLLCLAAAFAVAAAFQKCCPQPESEGKCGCCPDACCCMCENTTVACPTVPTVPTNPPQMTTTDIVCDFFGLDVVVVVDSSISITNADWNTTMEFLSTLVAQDFWFQVGTETKFAFVKFHSVAQVLWDLNDPETDSVASLSAAFLGEPQIQGFTNTIQGLQFAIDIITDPAKGDRDDTLYPDVIILLLDGKTNINASQAVSVSATAHSEAAVVITIGIGTEINETELAVFASGDGDDNVYLVADFDALITDLEIIAENLQESICETIFQTTTTSTLPPTTTCIPQVVETCKCCCPPLPDPCMPRAFGGTPDPCCCRFDQGGDKKKKRR